MKDLKHIKRFNESEENLNISDVRSSKSNGKVTKIGQKFKVKLSSTMRDDKFWEEDKIYTCDNIVEFEGLDNEIYVGDNWISDSFTMVV